MAGGPCPVPPMQNADGRVRRTQAPISCGCRSRCATPHDLRRTHGSTITKLGFGREAMNRIQNHKEGGIGDVYDRFEYSEENKRVMESTATHLLALAQGNGAPSNVVRGKF